MAVSLPDARQLPDAVLEALRLRALHGCELGFTEADLADLLGVARETVSRWWCAYAQGGIDALPHDRTGRPTGSGRTLDDQQAAHIQQLLDDEPPEDLEIASPLWSRRAVAELIAKEYGIDMPVRTVGEYLQRWGYTAKKPRRHSKDQDPEEVREWLEETYPAIEKRAKEEMAEIHWCDETGAAADRHPAIGYARQGQPHESDLNDHQRGSGSLHDLQGDDDRRLVHHVPQPVLAEYDGEDIPDPGSAAGACGGQGGGMGSRPSGADRTVLLAAILTG